MEPSSLSTPCLTDEQAIALMEKRVDEATRQAIDSHLDECDECRELVGALAMTGGPETESTPDPEVLEPPKEDGSITLLRDSSGARLSMPPAQSQGAPLHRGDMVDHFRVMRGLGRGAMGEVYLARDTMLGRKVALKIIAPDLLGSEKAVKRFLFEARATARFNHPNIVTIHAVGEYEGRPWVALEYVEGENLRERVQRERPPLRETLRIGLAVARALEQAHARGVLHRDLKPANVVIGTDARIRIVDFGLAKAVQATDDDVEAGVHAISSSTWLVGTPRYMAPEQWEGSNVEGAADIWALGVILFELLSGKRPFEAETTVELLRTVCSDQPAPRLATVASVPSRLSQLVASCLAKEPKQRPSAKEVAAQLEAIVQPARTGGAGADGPFRGLLPFGEAHAGTFFGREPEVDAFIERLRRQTIIPVVGPSGVGKSSFVQAGVIPRLRELEPWLVLPLRPGPRPFEMLASRLERGEGAMGAGESAQLPTVATIEQRAAGLREEPHRLALELLDLARRNEQKVLLVVDQLEELFTVVDDVELQHRFLNALATAADDLDDPVRVVLTMRHDFVDRLAAAGGAASPLARFFALKSPDRRMLEAALREPAEQAGYAFEDEDLVEQMIAAVQGEPACLALLQFAARRLWEERDEERELLLRSSYEAMGGVGGALARHADAQINGLAPSQQRIAQALLRRLVTPERTRRLVPRSEALAGLGTDAQSVLERLTDARLVSVIKVRRGEDPRVELTHGSLIHTWHRLASWVDQSGDDARLLEEATQAAELWDKRGQRPEELWRGEALRDAERHLSRSSLPDAVMRFLRASHVAEQQHLRRKTWGRMGSTGVLLGVAVVAVVASVYFVQRQRADQAARLAAETRAAALARQAEGAAISAARSALAERRPQQAKQQLREALMLADSAAARLTWLEIEQSPLVAREPASASAAEGASADWPLPLFPARVVAEGGGRVVGAMDRGVAVLPVEAPAGKGQAGGWLDVPHPVRSLSLEGAVLTAEGGGERTRWDLSRLGAAVAPSGQRVVSLAQVEGGWLTVDVGGELRQWRGQRLVAKRQLDGQQVAAGGPFVAVERGRVVELVTGAAIRRVPLDEPLVAMALGPLGRLATADAEGLTLWDGRRVAARLKERATGLAVHDATVAFVRPQGGLAVWEPPSRAWEEIATDPGPIHALALHGRTIAAARDGRVDLFRLGEGLTQQLPVSGATAVAFAHGGRTVLVATGAGAVSRWSLAGKQSDGVVTLMPDGAAIVADPAAEATKGTWRYALAHEGRRASQLEDGAPLCVMRADGQLAIWSTGANRRIGSHAVAGLSDVLGLPSGCAARTAEGVMLSSGSAPQALDLPGVPRAMGWAEQRLLVATDEAIIAFAESGDRLDRPMGQVAGATAITQIDSTVVVGTASGDVMAVATATGERRRIAGAVASPVRSLARGPQGLLAVGHASGDVAMVDLEREVVVWRSRLRGEAVLLRAAGDSLSAATSTGDRRRFDLKVLGRGRCDLLEVWGMADGCAR